MAAAFGQSEQNFEEEDPEQDEVAAQQALGIAVVDLTDQYRSQLRLDEDVEGIIVAAVDRNSDAQRKGFIRGDVILAANGKAVTSVADLEAVVDSAIAANRGAVLLKVLKRNPRSRERTEVFIPVRLRESN
jgi:serine protease Do